MITGFNTDIEQDGVVYHVQTEDKGLATPLILTLVYTGGTILASKRVAYDDLIAEGFNERVLSERLNRQHKLICAAIHAGRIEDLKRMTAREAVTRHTTTAVTRNASRRKNGGKSENDGSTPETTLPETDRPIIPIAPPQQGVVPAIILDAPEAAMVAPEKIVPQGTSLPAARTLAKSAVADFARAGAVAATGALHLSLIKETELRGGENVTLRVRVGVGADGREDVPAADVAVKILGSTFRPLLLSAKTNAQGIAVVNVSLPHFSSGRAALLVRVTTNEAVAELRRIIQQG
ncbi:MAG: hypothetical protein ABR577_06205 [Pyrinomonadaceae bacterium]